MRINLPVAAFLIAFLPGCSLLGGEAVSEDNFYDQYSDISCKVNQKCYRAYFESEWDDIGECVDDLTDAAEDYEDFYDDCDFDDGKAEDCLAAIKDAECGDFYDPEDAADIYEDCAEVWDCN